MIVAQAPTLARLLSVSTTKSAAVAATSPDPMQQLEPLALTLDTERRSVEQLASNQDQLARKQDQMAQSFAMLQSAVRDINQNILALAPLAPKAAHILPAKPPQTPAQ